MTPSLGRNGNGDQMTLPRAWGRDAARLLALLREERHGGVTVETMREQGIDAPAQAIYTLQLAGYTIDRVSGAATGHGTPVYRLSGRRADLNARSSVPDAGADNDA